MNGGPLHSSPPHSALSTARPALPYEQQLFNNPRWALTEGSLFFEGGGAVQIALQRITQRLNALEIPYAVVGGMALFHHGVRRFTEDVDILVTRESLKLIHEQLDGLGYVPPFSGSKNLRDADNGVKIEFLLTGHFPGDGKPKPIAFPDPVPASLEHDGIRYLRLEPLLELKLASGMTGLGRQKDLADVVALIQSLHLPLELAERLNPFVRLTYQDLWRQAKAAEEYQTRDQSWDAEGES